MLNNPEDSGTYHNNQITLKDGRKLGYQEYGIQDGFPILALHGTPGSRIWFKGNDPVSSDLGIRLITIDRPGYGLPDRLKNRKIIDFNEDINELVEILEINRFSIFGVSGGGAYALAYETANNQNLIKVGLVASVYEFIDGKPPKEMCRPNRISFFLARHMPWILNFNFKQQKKLFERYPEIYIRSAQKKMNHLCHSDQEVLKSEETSETMVMQFKEAFKNYHSEPTYELSLLSKKWELEYSAITSQVEVWHGENDTLSPISGLKEFIKIIPRTNDHFIKGRGHFLDEDIELWRRILQSLL